VFGCEDKRGFKIGTFFGVIMIVTVRPRRAKWWMRSRSGRMWPCAGYGNARM